MKRTSRPTYLMFQIMTVCVLTFIMTGCDDQDPPATQAPAAPPPSPSPPETPSTTSLLDSLNVKQDIDTSGSTTKPTDPTVAEFLGLRAPKPTTWLWQPPKRSMRKANYIIPGRNGEEPAELIVTHFAESSGNTADANVRRWKSQFRSNDGGPAKADVQTFVVNEMPVTLVEIHGEYMGMGGAWHKPNHRMLVSIVQAPVGSVFIKMLGPNETVLEHQDAYVAMIKGLEQR